MKQYFIILFIGMVIESCFSPLMANEPIEITFISSDPPKSEDFDSLTVVMQKLLSYIPDKVSGDFKIMSFKRGWRILQSRDNVCVFPRIKTEERLEFANFNAKPIAIIPSFRLYVPEKLLPLYRSKASLEAILSEPNVKIGVNGDISYGEAISELFLLYPNKIFQLQNTVLVEETERNLIKMVMSGRLSGYIGVANGVGHPPNIARLRFEEAGEVIPLYLACSLGPLAKEALSIIDEAYETPAFQQYLLSQHFKGFPKAEHAIIEKYFKFLAGITKQE